jgi:hypothetical protein
MAEVSSTPFDVPFEISGYMQQEGVALKINVTPNESAGCRRGIFKVNIVWDS